MKNILGRDEYLAQVNEGIFRDTLKRGFDKVKSIFKIGIKKIKDFIAVFDKNGNVLPVVTPQAVIDKFSDVNGIDVYATPDLSKSTVEAGGKGCAAKATITESDEIYDFGPSGRKFSKWMKEEKYKDTIEYKNLMSLPSIIKENYDSMSDDMKELFEDWSEVKQDRVKYNKSGELREIKAIDVKEFEKKLSKMIDDTIINGGKTIKREDGKVKKPWRNILVFGAPGIGKSTVPNLVINKYNEAAGSAAEKMALITVDCPNIAVGDFMMPTMPQVKMVQDIINKNPEAFPKAKEYLDGLTPEQSAALDKSLEVTKQFESNDAPKSWLPSYKKTGDNQIDALLDTYANGGVYTDDEGNTHKTGNGGIILFDEFLRTDPNVFKQLMIFLLTRELNGWTLGSKWVIIACSNRPCDDTQVDEVWGEWNGGSAAKDRFERMYHLEPNPEQWKTWAKSKGCDELLLKFIFDDSSKIGDEYPRWHSMISNGSRGEQVLPISPRRWQSAFEAINSYEIDEDYDDISQMRISEIKECLDGIFDESFVTEITTWIEDHMDSVSLDEIIKSPKDTYLPKKFSGKDEAKAVILIQNIWEQFESKFKEHPEECTDDVLKNIMIWFGLNYKNTLNTVKPEFIDNLESVLKNHTDNSLINHVNGMLMIYAAWPQQGMEEEIEYLAKEGMFPEDSLEIVKKYMREYFPWRISGDKIKYYDELNID